MPNLINRKKQMILFTIILFIFSCQLSLAQEEAQEIKIENKNEFIQEETQLSTENLPKEEVTTITETPKQEKASTTKKKSSKKKKRKTEQSNSGMQTPQTLSDEEKTKKERDSKRIAYFILFAICLYIVYKILSYRHRRKCDHCGKWAAMKKTGTYCVDKKAKKIKEELKTRDGKGNVIRSREVLVDATTYFIKRMGRVIYVVF